MLKQGDRAPDVQLETDAGNAFHFSDLKGKRTILFFFPKADTSG